MNEEQSKLSSNFLRLECDELLSEVRINYKKTTLVQNVLISLKECLERIPEQQVEGSKNSHKFRDIPLLYSKTKDSSESKPERARKKAKKTSNEETDVWKLLKLRWKPPTKVELIGSFLLRTVTKPVLNVDVGIQIPSLCFKEKDVLYYRYYDKRALYLHVVSRELQNSKLFEEITWSTFNNNPNKPILVLKPTPDERGLYSNFVIRLIPMIEPKVFKMSKLLPDKKLAEAGDDSTNSPLYNNGIVEDMMMFDHLQLLHKYLTDYPNLIDAIILFKVWLRKRHQDVTPQHHNSETFNGFLISMLLAHLLDIHVLTTHMNSLQMFKVGLQYLATADLSKGIFMQESASEDIRTVFVNAYDVVFVDPSGFLNLAAHMDKNSFLELCEEARTSLQCLNDPVRDEFYTVFMARVDIYSKYDHYIRISNFLEGGPRSWTHFSARARAICKILERGLGDRVKKIKVLPHAYDGWTSNQSFEEIVRQKNSITVGLILNPVRARSKIDSGPPADNAEEVAKYVEFWGSKAERRMFKDGSIVMACVWEGNLLPTQQIVNYLLHKYFQISEYSVYYIADQLDSLLVRNQVKELANAAQVLLNTLEKISNEMKSLQDLPLEISSLSPISPEFRYTSVFSPEVISGNAVVNPVEVVLQFESSGNWPDDLTAIGFIKAAFYLKLAEGMQNKYRYKAMATKNYLELITQHFVFRFFIHNEKELSLMSQEIENDRAMYPIRQKYNYRPLHASILHNFHLKFPSFGPTVRLALRWLHSHMFSPFYSTEVVELIVAYLFTHPVPYSVPNNHLVGFKRFVDFMANFDFAEYPIIVNFDEQPMDAVIMNQIVDAFNETRKNHSEEKAIFIAHSQDPQSEMWTKYQPSPQILARTSQYAKHTMSLLQKLFELEDTQEQNSNHMWKTVFQTPLHTYHALIRLKQTELPKYYEQNVSLKMATKFPKTNTFSIKRFRTDYGEVIGNLNQFFGWDPPANYLVDLENHHGNEATFFYDQLGGDVIGVVFAPDVTASSKKVMVEHFKVMGDGLVEDVELH